MRILSPNFIKELKGGTQQSLLEYIRHDNTLDLEIRNNYINIYYRGGNILKVTHTKNLLFIFHFEEKYLKSTSFKLEQALLNSKINRDWDNFFPLAKQAMDFYFTKYLKQEREYQQLVVRENNYSSIANGTDYFILDIEYDTSAKARFDLIAVEWPSKASHRKLSKGFKPKLVIIEMKYGDGSFKGSAGIQKHINDFNSFTSNLIHLAAFKNEMLALFKQKRDLGVIPSLSGIGKTNSNPVIQFADEIDMLFLIVNHDPASHILKTELKGLEIQNSKFVTSNFMGYGLYIENVFDYVSFDQRYKFQI